MITEGTIAALIRPRHTMTRWWRRDVIVLMSLTCLLVLINVLVNSDYRGRSTTSRKSGEVGNESMYGDPTQVSSIFQPNKSFLTTEETIADYGVLRQTKIQNQLQHKHDNEDLYSRINIPEDEENEASESRGDHDPSESRSVLLLASTGRSGSSFLGELLASQGNNMYIFEPIRLLKKSDQNEKNVVQELLNNFRCNIRQEILGLGTSPYVNIKHHYTHAKKKEQVSLPAVVEYCKAEPIRIIKSIRVRLAWTKQLLNDRDLNLKVVHIVRDPRGSALSIARVEWQMTTSDMCRRVLEDLQARTEIAKRFPGRYFFITYEDLCRDPYGSSRKILYFLRKKPENYDWRHEELLVNDVSSVEAVPGKTNSHRTNGNHNSSKISSKSRITDVSLSSDLPEGVLSYLQSHIHINMLAIKDAWTTVRDTRSVYQQWRRIITQQQLTTIEAQCDQVIRALNHSLFGSIKNARNLSLSLFL